MILFVAVHDSGTPIFKMKLSDLARAKQGKRRCADSLAREVQEALAEQSEVVLSPCHVVVDSKYLQDVVLF